MRLMNLLLNRETLQTVAQWVTEFWWAVLLMGIAFIIFMGIFIKCCAVHTPSSNPKKPPARRISETLRRPMTTLRRMVSSKDGRVYCFNTSFRFLIQNFMQMYFCYPFFIQYNVLFVTLYNYKYFFLSTFCSRCFMNEKLAYLLNNFFF